MEGKRDKKEEDSNLNVRIRDKIVGVSGLPYHFKSLSIETPQVRVANCAADKSKGCLCEEASITRSDVTID